MGPPGFQKGVVAAPKKSNLEQLMENFGMSHTLQNEDFRNQNLHTNGVLRLLTTKVENITTHNKMLESQISQISH